MLSNEEIGARIAARRCTLSMTMDEVATKIGVNRSTIQRYESGKIKKLKLPVIESIASALNVNPSWLIGTSDDPTPIPSATEANTDDIVKMALFGSTDVDDDVYEEVKRFAKFTQEQKKKEQ